MTNTKELCLFTQALQQLLENYIAAKNAKSAEMPPISELYEKVGIFKITCPLTLLRLTSLFQLSEFEFYILLLCVALEIEPHIGKLCAEIQRSELSSPTPHLALKILPQPDWNAFHADSPLLHWQFIQIKDTQPFSLSPLSIEPSLFLYLLGANYIDRHLDGFIKTIDQNLPLTPSQQDIATALSTFWSNSFHTPQPLLQLHNTDPSIHRQILLNAARESGRTPHHAFLSSFTLNTPIASNPTELRNLARRWERAARLSDGVLLLECQGVDLNELASQFILKTLLAEIQAPLILSADTRLNLPGLSPQIVEIPPANYIERKTLWQTYLGDRAASLNGTLEAIADNFALTPQSIATICQQTPPQDTPEELSKHLWQNCRHHARSQLDRLAQRVETPLTWDDLILPEKTKQTLQQILDSARARFQVYHQWGMTQKRPRGLGICALFSGYSGTGKTTAAEIIAQELNLDCYRVDLSTIVSKYIGETEKNLKRIFDAAEGGGVVLLFDEADALFGKRGEIKEARDRFSWSAFPWRMRFAGV